MMPRRTCRRLGAAVVVACAFIGSATSPARAEPTGRIAEVTPSAGSLQVVFVGNDLPDGSVIDPHSVRVTLDGVQLPATARRVTAQDQPVKRTAMLVLDVSGSMTPERLAGEKAAAVAFLDALPTGVSVGLITFSDAARLTVRPTTNLAAIRSRIPGLKAGGNTALYDATVLAVRSLPADGVRNIVLLTDGQDDGSRTTLTTAAAIVKGSRANLTAVSIGTARAQTGALRTLANAGSGGLVATDRTDDLAGAFRQAAREIDNQLVVDVPVPDDVKGTSGNLTVTATAGGSSLSSTAFVSLSEASTQTASPTQQALPVVTRSPPLSHTVLYTALGGLFLALVLVIAFALGTATKGTRPEEQMRRRLSIYTLTGRKPKKIAETTTTALGASAVVRSAVELADRVVQNRDLEAVLARKLDSAAIPLKSSEWLLIHSGITVLSALALFLISGGGILPMLLGLIIGGTAPLLYLDIKKSRREKAFMAALPDTLQLLAGSLQVGYSLPQALDAVVREGQEPVVTEFNRALVQSRLGVPVDDALDGIGARMESKDFSWVVMAIRIQREVGGNLAEVLTTVAATLRERERLRRQVQTLSAEGLLSAWILGALPPLFAIYLLFARPEYLRVLYTDPAGIVLLVGGVVLLAVGAIWLSKVVKVEV